MFTAMEQCSWKLFAAEKTWRLIYQNQRKSFLPIGFISASFIELNKLVHGKDVDKKNLENIVKVGLWCVQDEPALRPSMKCVVMMLEGITDIANPPCPTASSGKIL